MEMGPWGIISAVVAGISALMNAYFVYIINKRKQIQVERMQLMPIFESRIGHLEEELEKSQGHRVDCEAKHAALFVEVKELKEREQLKEAILRMSDYIHTRNHDILDVLSTAVNKITEMLLILQKVTDGAFTIKTTPPDEVKTKATAAMLTPKGEKK